MVLKHAPMAVEYDRLAAPCILLHRVEDNQPQDQDTDPSFPYRTHRASAAVAVVGGTRAGHVLDPIVVVVVGGAVTSLVDVVVRGHPDLAMFDYEPI